GPVYLHRAVAGTTAFHAEHAILELAVDGLAADDEVVCAAADVQRNVELGVQRVLAAFHGALGPRQEGGRHERLPLFAAHPGMRAAGADGSIAAVELGVAQPFGHGERQGPPVVAGFDPGQRHEAVAELPLPLVGQRPLVAGEALVGRVAHARRRAPDAVDAVDRAERIGGRAEVVGVGRVVVLLPRRVVVELYALECGGLPRHRRTGAAAGAVDGLAAAAEA